MSFLRNRFARVLSVVLILQAIVLYAAVARPEHVPAIKPLASFPSSIGGWRTAREVPIEPEVLEILKADDTLNRVYVSPEGTTELDFFIAFFKTQREGQSPHSPKNCLPGNGWEPIETNYIPIAVPGRSPMTANRYVVTHGEDKAVVMYWYQSRQRIIASEYAAKFWLIADSIRYHRSDTALVKIVVPVAGNDLEGATETGVRFIRTAFPEVVRALPH